MVQLQRTGRQTGKHAQDRHSFLARTEQRNTGFDAHYEYSVPGTYCDLYYIAAASESEPLARRASDGTWYARGYY